MADTFVPIMDPVESSNVHSIGYDDPTSTLFVRFWKESKSRRSYMPGPVYKYFNVPKGIYVKFMNAPSKGQFVWQNLRDTYRYKMVGRSGWRIHAPKSGKKRSRVPAAAKNRRVITPYVPKSRQPSRY